MPRSATGPPPAPRAAWVSLVLVCWALVGVLLGPTPAVAAPRFADPVGRWPLHPQPAVIHDFDPPSSPYGPGHRGVDLAGRLGQQVATALAGQVTYAGALAGRGVVVVSHGATRTTYEPVTASVAVGTSVAAGEVIGTLELARSHCLPQACLHWGWIHGETYLDPLRLVGLGPVRLLPLWRDQPAGAPVVPTTSWATRDPVSPYAAWLPPARSPGPPSGPGCWAQALGWAC